MNVNDIVVNGWNCKVAQAAHADPEMRARVARVIDATKNLLKASPAELAAAIDEQNDAITALKNYASVKKPREQITQSVLVTETS